jgi:hypothetical protein
MVKTHKSPGTDQSRVELIKAGRRTIRCEIHKLINSIWIKEELFGERKESIIGPIYKKGDKTGIVITKGYHVCQLSTKFYPKYAVKFTSLCRGIY